jgi:Zn-dependent protease with chaperone function
MHDVAGNFFAGPLAPARPVRVRWHAFDGVLEISEGAAVRRVPRRQLSLEVRRIGGAAHVIRLRDGTRCEIPASPEVDALVASWGLGGPTQRRAPLEARWPLLMALVFVIFAAGIAAVHWGVPWAARRVASALPADLLRQVGEQTLAAMDASTLRRTQLTHERQLELEKKFRDFLAAARVDAAAGYHLAFRAAPDVGPNAFALPDGTIVLTDELVQLAADDREILGVLAHECGHLARRHAVRGLLQNSAFALAVSFFTGDLASGFGASLASFLVETRYSRDFEREADRYALETLRAAQIDPAYLGRMLERIEAKAGASKTALPGYLSTHPPTPERLETIRGQR